MILPFATTWINLGEIMFSEVSQTQKQNKQNEEKNPTLSHS